MYVYLCVPEWVYMNHEGGWVLEEARRGHQAPRNWSYRWFQPQRRSARRVSTPNHWPSLQAPGFLSDFLTILFWSPPKLHHTSLWDPESSLSIYHTSDSCMLNLHFKYNIQNQTTKDLVQRLFLLVSFTSEMEQLSPSCLSSQRIWCYY